MWTKETINGDDVYYYYKFRYAGIKPTKKIVVHPKNYDILVRWYKKENGKWVKVGEEYTVFLKILINKLKNSPFW